MAKNSDRVMRLVTSLVNLSKKHNLAQHAQQAKKVLVKKRISSWSMAMPTRWWKKARRPNADSRGTPKSSR